MSSAAGTSEADVQGKNATLQNFATISVGTWVQLFKLQQEAEKQQRFKPANLKNWVWFLLQLLEPQAECSRTRTPSLQNFAACQRRNLRFFSELQQEAEKQAVQKTGSFSSSAAETTGSVQDKDTRLEFAAISVNLGSTVTLQADIQQQKGCRFYTKRRNKFAAQMSECKEAPKATV